MTSRRSFIKKSSIGGAAIALAPSFYPDLLYSRKLGANEQIKVAVIGIRSRAKALIMGISKYPNAHIVYNCDVDQIILEEHNQWCEANLGYIPKTENDFRRILEDKEVDAIFIATPEHWHAPMAIAGLQAGKHVYVEKPCSHNPAENQMLIDAQEKYGLKVQMGNQQRSALTSIKAIEDIRNGVIGEVFKGEAYYSNNRQSIGKGNEIAVPTTHSVYSGADTLFEFKPDRAPIESVQFVSIPTHFDRSFAAVNGCTTAGLFRFDQATAMASPCDELIIGKCESSLHVVGELPVVIIGVLASE